MTPQVANRNSGHGHVWERPDGMRVRCGGPKICAQCAVDYANYHNQPLDPVQFLKDQAEAPMTDTKARKAAEAVVRKAVEMGYITVPEIALGSTVIAFETEILKHFPAVAKPMPEDAMALPLREREALSEAAMAAARQFNQDPGNFLKIAQAAIYTWKAAAPAPPVAAPTAAGDGLTDAADANILRLAAEHIDGCWNPDAAKRFRKIVTRLTKPGAAQMSDICKRLRAEFEAPFKKDGLSLERDPHSHGYRNNALEILWQEKRDATIESLQARISELERERDSERTARENLDRCYREKDKAMGELFRRLDKAGVDCSDLLP